HIWCMIRPRRAQVAELVDAHGSGPCAARCGGSSPLLGTIGFYGKPSRNLVIRRITRFFVFTAPFMETVTQPAPNKPAISRQELALIAITMIWGGTFLAVQQALAVSGPLFFVGLRFASAALLAAVFSR